MKIDLNIAKLEEWNLGSHNPFIIAGPCSVESEDQVFKTAIALRKYKVAVLRAGIWKPRTRPNSFEGVGEKGLQWLKDVRSETNLPVAVEVANPEQVEKCLKYKIDVLWIGARTTPNPFAVQAIADSLKGVDIPVMVKNPINSDLELWIGALERLNFAGIRKLLAIHRGFSFYKINTYRNQPLWRIPIELKRVIPNIPILCDPSHICGNTALILSVAQKALDLLFNGLMIEVHINPQKALSDSNQQLTPDEFGKLLDHLRFKKMSTDDRNYMSLIGDLRKKIDELDNQLIELLARRMEYVKKIAVQKKRNNISIFQPDRWNEIIRDRIQNGKMNKLSEKLISNLFQLIHEESIEQQGKE